MRALTAEEVSLAPLSSGEGLRRAVWSWSQGLKDGIGEAALEYAKCLASAVPTALASARRTPKSSPGFIFITGDMAAMLPLEETAHVAMLAKPFTASDLDALLVQIAPVRAR